MPRRTFLTTSMSTSVGHLRHGIMSATSVTVGEVGDGVSVHVTVRLIGR